MDKVDFFIVMTDRQKEILAEQFAKYTNHQPAIYTIPVGESCGTLQDENRTPFSMITASRLAIEEAYWLVGASSGSYQKELPELSFDIWKRWRKKAELRALIDELGAADYIISKGMPI